jgi:hypothetical protein
VRFYFDFSNYWKMLRLARRERNTAARRYYLFVLLVPVPLVSGFHAICFLLDALLFPDLRKTEIRNPVFIVGHARSGTTLVHRLMSRDEGRFSSFMLYELYFPSLLQKKLIRFVARIDRDYFGGRIAKRVRVWEDGHYAAIRRIHEMGLTQPEEDDLVFYYSLASGFWITKMPYMGDLDFYYVDRWSERKRKRLMQFYADCIRRQLMLNGPDRVHLSKNPVFAGRVAALIEAFPDARIVVPVRNPNETIPSLLALVRSGWKRLDWDAERVNRCLRILADQSFHTYRYPLEVLSQHPETASAVLDYRELVADPAATIGQVYRELGFEMSAPFRETLAAESARSRKHVSTHSYSLEEFGLDADEIRSQLVDLFERFGWDRDGGKA